MGPSHIGSALAGRLTSLGHSVFIASSRGSETLDDVAHQTGYTPAMACGHLLVGTYPADKHPEAT